MQARSSAGSDATRKNFLYILKAGPAGGRLRRPSSAGSTIRPTPCPADAHGMVMGSTPFGVGYGTTHCGLGTDNVGGTSTQRSRTSFLYLHCIRL
jgi:hypothetical protein